MPRKFNITVTGCMDNCTHNESQGIALIPAKKGRRLGFNVLVGGKMGSGGFAEPPPSPFFRALVACVGTDYCNLALIETKSRAAALSEALHKKFGDETNPMTIYSSGCPAGCGNHEAADLGLRGFKTKIDGKLVDAVAVYVGGRTGAHARPGKEILATVPGDDKFADVIVGVMQANQTDRPHVQERSTYVPLFAAAATVELASWPCSSPIPATSSAVG